MKLTVDQSKLLTEFARRIAVANGHTAPAEYADLVVNGPAVEPAPADVPPADPVVE